MADPEGVELVEVPVADLDLPAPVDRLAALALQRARTALVIRVPKALETDAPVVLTLRGTSTGEVRRSSGGRSRVIRKPKPTVTAEMPSGSMNAASSADTVRRARA